MNYRTHLFVWILALVPLYLGAQVYSEQMVRNFAISSKSTIEVNNKYGKVHVVTWSKDSVKFVVDMRVSASDQQKLEKLKSSITFDFTSTNYYIVARTLFSKSGGIFSDMVETVVPSNNVSINYTVYLPANANLKIDNKFGDVYIDDFSGNLGLILSNGALKSNRLEGNTSIQLSSADALIKSIVNGTITLRYSDFELASANRLDLDTKYSNITLEKVNQMKVISRRDNYKIGQVNVLSGTGDFTKLRVGALQREMNFSNKYYSLVVEDINTQFSLVNVVSDLTDVELRFARGSSFNLDVTHHPEVYLTVPTINSKLQTKELGGEEKLLLTYGTLGTSTSENLPKVKILAERKCYINIIQK
ncbi:MAG: hypothetical protein IPM71_04005 [Bacteroidota bacterium]|nr:MAG: hypothetical protein IPM71_04005 [Bacteroidota bacterium]